MKKSIKIALFLVALLVLPFGCSQFSDSTKCTGPRSYTQAEVRAMFNPLTLVLMGDANYAEVNPEFAGPWHDYTNKVMNLLGMAPNWNQQFDCNRFALMKLAVIHVRFLVDTWHSRNPAQAPAAGEIWYTPDSTRAAGIRHAIIVTIETGGRKVYRDIYSAKELRLTQTEEDSIGMVKF